MNNDRLIPKLREDIVFKVIEENNQKKILLWDKSQIASQPLVFPEEIISLLSAFDGETTIGKLRETLSTSYQGKPEDIDNFIQTLELLIDDLDVLLYLETPRFEYVRNDIINYLNSKVRPSCCADSSYPNDIEKLSEFISSMLETADIPKLQKKINGIIVPHIDYRIGFPAHHIYANAYQNIIGENYDVYIILGTSHYGNSDYFMFTTKDFETPFGIVHTDIELIDEFTHNYKFDVTYDDLAHRNEHSLEYPIIWLQFLFKNQDIKILPIAVGSFQEFIYNHKLPLDDEKILTFYEMLRKVIFEKYQNPLFIASVDFSHVGRKFGDPFDAISTFDDVKFFDKKLINHLENNDYNSFFKEHIYYQDKYKVCGISPIYSIYGIMQPQRAYFLGYDYWDDRENQSIVSFASFALEL
ncbi:MAG: AmmeMemoRadiSam system protein B [Candidatus Kapaibacteriales bacterium]